MRMRHADLSLAAFAAVVCAAIVIAVPLDLLRGIAAIVLCVVLPGYALTAAAFARRDLERHHQFLVALLLSLATLALGAVVLNVAPSGITRTAWTVLVGAIVLGACRVAAHRRWTSPHHGVRPALPRPPRASVALLAAAGLAVAGGVALSRTPLPAGSIVGYSQLWMIPSGPSERPVLGIGVRSAERRTEAYRLELKVGQDTRVLRARLVLRPGEVFEQRVRLRRYPSLARERSGVAIPQRITKVTALLYRLEGPEAVYRRVTAEIR